MAFDKAQIDLILNIVGQQGVDNLARSTDNYKKLLEQLHHEYQQGNIDVDQWIAKSSELRGKIEEQAHLLDQLKGVKSANGRGILGASYAVQDFVSVLTGGGGLVRALGAVSNNVDQVATAAGASVATAAKLSLGFTGLVAVLPVLTPLFKQLWEAMSGESGKGPAVVVKALDEAEERVKEIQAALDKIMKSRPMREKETAGLVEEFYAESEGGQEKIQRGLAAAMAQAGQGATMTEKEKKEIEDLTSNVEVAKQSVIPGVLEGQQQALRNAQLRIQKRITKENERMAWEMMAEATRSPAARRRMRQLAGQAPGGLPKNFAEHFAEIEPEAIARQEAEMEDENAPGTEAYGERLKKAREKRQKAAKDRRAEVEEEATTVGNELDSSNADHARAKAEAARKKREAEAEAKREAAQAKRDAAAAKRDAAAAKRAPHEEAIRQAEVLTQQAPDIVGANFGPEAGMSVANAPPAQLNEMTQQIVHNLESGQFPADAVLNAFRQIAEASARNAAANQRFGAQLNGMGRMQGRIYNGTTQAPGASGSGW